MAMKLDRELEQLGSMTRVELVDRWQAVYGCPPPAGARRELLMYAAGWHIQARRLGGLSGEVRRMLRREMERIKRECRVDRSRSNDDAHDDANPPIEGGYVFEAKVYPSLSAIARRITGAHWSGPRFFGL